MSEFESFDYTKVTVAENQMSQYMDGYEHFGWRVDSNVPIEKGMGKVTIHLKRSRAVLNKMELTRLQRHFEACMSEIAALENSTESFAMIAGTDQWDFRLCIYGGFGIRCDGCKTNHLDDDFARNPGIFSVGNRISAL